MRLGAHVPAVQAELRSALPAAPTRHSLSLPQRALLWALPAGVLRAVRPSVGALLGAAGMHRARGERGGRGAALGAERRQGPAEVLVAAGAQLTPPAARVSRQTLTVTQAVLDTNHHQVTSVPAVRRTTAQQERGAGIGHAPRRWPPAIPCLRKRVRQLPVFP